MRGLIALRNSGVVGGPAPSAKVFGQLLREQGLPTLENEGRGRQSAKEKAARDNRKQNQTAYDAASRPLPPLALGQRVRVQHHATKRWTLKGAVRDIRPNSVYAIETEGGGVLRRARTQIRPDDTEQTAPEPEIETENKQRRSSRQRRPPSRLDL